MPRSQNVSRTPWETVAPARLAPKNGPLKSLKNCDRSFRTPARMSSNTVSGSPPGLAGVFSISGVIALIRTALATRAVPWRPMYRATSPPPVE